jgi:hypothetical protein
VRVRVITGLPETLTIELEVGDDCIDAVVVNDIDTVGVPDNDLYEVNVRIPDADGVARVEGVACDTVETNEGVA